MRFIARALLCAGLLLAATGCDPAANRHYFREGVGTSLYSEDVASQTEMQNIYVEHICQQAGLGPNACTVDTFSPTVWGLFVQAGMNDIDQRCDAYLTWLDNVRRSQAPILKQFSDTHTATELIMQTAGVGAGPIAIVAAAFGLATNTFNNVTSRLVLEVNHSTVQQVVLTRQTRFREDLLGNRAKHKPPVIIASKPAAIYALRSYLRLCMPITIETEINTTVAVFERGGAPALMRSQPMISAKSVGVTTIPHIARDSSVKSLRELLRPHGAKKPDPELLAYVRRLLGNPNVAVGPILIDPGFATLRQRLAACIISRNAGHPCRGGSLAKYIQ